ncbi:hypothetical protein FNF28_06990 [Cafeteria roenbergensis]|uniref:UDENN domain-containing protein n=1 Tax=Cafeteria roenbergensis TaxID=33653 RepID=A0A5A8CIJ4_CAFRO|nr:hypothetical protein FNF28_06990 [Cafeteria roenbergensis]
MALAPVPSDASPLRCVAWAEQDLAGEWTVVWSFPGPSSREAECLIAARSPDVDGPCFSRVGDDWCYSAPVAYAAPRERGRAAGAVHLIASEFHPERWLSLAAHVAGLAEADPSPMPMQRAYLEAVTSGEVAGADGPAWRSDATADGAALMEASRLGAVCRILGRDLPVVWAALLLRRRVVFYAGSAADVCQACRAMPLLVAHRGRREWERLRPLVCGAAGSARLAAPLPGAGAPAAEVKAAREAAAAASSSAAEGAVSAAQMAAAGGLAELAELATTSWSIAGTTAAALEGMPSLWDVWVDLSARRVAVSAACEGLLRADTPAHATAMAAAVEAATAAGGAGAEAAGPAIGRALAKVSKQLVAKLSDVGEPTEAALEAAGVSGPMVQLMLGIARAEPGVRVPPA